MAEDKSGSPDWQYEIGDELVRDGVYILHPDQGSIYTVDRRVVDVDSGERFYRVNWTVDGQRRAQLKLASIVHKMFTTVSDETAATK